MHMPERGRREVRCEPRRVAMNQHIKFVDVTEECRRLYGRVQSNCSLLEVWV